MRSALPKNPTFFLLCCSSPSGFCPKISYDIPRHPTAPPSCLKHSWRIKQYIKPKQETFIFISTFFFFFPQNPERSKNLKQGWRKTEKAQTFSELWQQSTEVQTLILVAGGDSRIPARWKERKHRHKSTKSV